MSERIQQELEKKEREEQEREARLIHAIVDQDMEPPLDVKIERESLSAVDKTEFKPLADMLDNELEQAKVRKRSRPANSTVDGRNDSRTRLVDELISSIIIKPEPESIAQPLSDAAVRPGPSEHNATEPLEAKRDGDTSPSQEGRARKRARLAPVDPLHSSLSNAGLAPRPPTSERVSVVHTSRAAAFNQRDSAGNKRALLAQSRSLKADGGSALASMAKRTAVTDMVKNETCNPDLFKDLTFSHDVEAGYEAMEAAITNSGGKLVPLMEVRDGTFVHYLINRM